MQIASFLARIKADSSMRNLHKTSCKLANYLEFIHKCRSNGHFWHNKFSGEVHKTFLLLLHIPKQQQKKMIHGESKLKSQVLCHNKTDPTQRILSIGRYTAGYGAQKSERSGTAAAGQLKSAGGSLHKNGNAGQAALNTYLFSEYCKSGNKRKIIRKAQAGTCAIHGDGQRMPLHSGLARQCRGLLVGRGESDPGWRLPG